MVNFVWIHCLEAENFNIFIFFFLPKIFRFCNCIQEIFLLLLRSILSLGIWWHNFHFYIKIFISSNSFSHTTIKSLGKYKTSHLRYKTQHLSKAMTWHWAGLGHACNLRSSKQADTKGLITNLSLDHGVKSEQWTETLLCPPEVSKPGVSAREDVSWY